MPRSTSLVLPMLAASVLINVVLLTRPARAPRLADAPHSRSAQAQPAERPTPVEAGPAARTPPATAASAARTTTSRLDVALADHETWSRFWTELARVHEAGEALEPAEYRAHVLESTADFLAVDRASFAAAVAQALANVDALGAQEPVEMTEEPDAQALDALSRRMAERQEAAYGPVRALLAPDSNRVHKRFLARFAEWESMLRAWGP